MVKVEEVKLKLSEKCTECKGQLLAPQLKKAIETAYQVLQNEQKQLGGDKTLSKEPQPKCTFCGNKIDHPNLEYQIGKKNFRSKDRDRTVDTGKMKFYSAQQILNHIQGILKRQISNQRDVFQLKLLTLRTHQDYKVIFWNLIYYFNEHTLPFDCILPYESDEFQTQLDEYKKLNQKQVVIQKPRQEMHRDSQRTRLDASPTLISNSDSSPLTRLETTDSNQMSPLLATDDIFSLRQSDPMRKS